PPIAHPLSPPAVSSRERLNEDAAKSTGGLRAERLSEIAQWTTAFNSHQKEFIRLLHEIGSRAPARLWPTQVAEIFAKKLDHAFRYLAWPPMAAEDLRAAAGVTLVASRLAKDPEAARRVLEAIRQRLDDCRFPWVADRRPPTKTEQHTAVVASAAMMTAQAMPPRGRMVKEALQEKARRDFRGSWGSA